MKYWLFDGNDVVGLFSPQELSARAEFSAASMVAPETDSENQNAWKMASSFPEFQFDEDGRPISANTTPETAPLEKIETAVEHEPAIAPASVPVPAEDFLPPVQKKQDDIQSIPLAAPIRLAEETEDTILLSRDEAQSAALPTETPLLQPNTSEITRENTATMSISQEPEETILSTCTLPLAGDPQTTVSLPTVEESINAAAQPEPFSADLAEPISVRETVRPHLESNTEIDDFLQEQQEARQPNREKAKWMLWVLLLLLIPGMIALAVHWGLTHEKKIPAALITPLKPKSAKTEAGKKLEEPAVVAPVVKTPEETKSADVTPVQEPAKPAQPTKADRAIETVKNHLLAGNKGTIVSYFDRLYKKELSSGYSEEWSAEPLHKNIYIVKYRLTKTRQEPIVYVFQADTSKNKLTGALNNVALDLIGKI